MKTEKFNFDAPDCTCEYRHGTVARNMVGHTPPCPVYERWQAMISGEEKPSVNARPNMRCIHKLVDQIIEHARNHLGAPVTLRLSHEEIDAWRCQFDGSTMPVGILCFRGIPIVEESESR